MPERLFHYKRFVEDHLVALLSKAQVRLSRPDHFNDPWDCRVHYQIPTDPPGRKRLFDYLADMHRKHHPSIPEAQRALLVYDLKSNPAKFDAAMVAMERQMYAEICKRYRVYCLAEKPDNPLMWAHYAGAHTGICLEFDARRGPFTAQTGATKVEYRSTYPARDLVTMGYEPLVTKSDHWSYEAEWRLIAEESIFAQSPDTLKTDDNFLTLPSDALKSVIVGALADASTRNRIERLVNFHGKGVLIRHAAVAPNRYELLIDPPIR